MSRVQLLRALVNERLSAAAEEIFEAVRKTIAGYEEEILLSKREIRRQRSMLQTALKPGGKSGERADQPQLVLSIGDEDFPSSQQQQCDQECSSLAELGYYEAPQSDPRHEQLPSGQEEEEVNIIRFIFTPPTIKNELDQHQSEFHSTKGEADPLPSTSTEQDQTEVAGDGGASAGSHDDGDEEWRASGGDLSDDGVGGSHRKERKMAPKLLPTKKAKSQICCKVCGKSFHADVSLVNHMEVHPKDVCGVCGERFDTEEIFRVHLKTHVRAGICSVCGKCFGTSGALETHMRIHTGEKPFNCSECGKSFSCRHNMMRHIRIHTGEKPYTCSICGKCFNDYSTMKRHLVVHIHQKNLDSKKTSTSGNEPGDDVDEPPGGQEEQQLQEQEDNNIIRFIFTPPTVTNVLDQNQSEFHCTKGEADPLPSTSTEQDQTEVEGDGDGGASASSHNDCDEEWRASGGDLSDDSTGSLHRKERKRPPIAPKLHLTKKAKSRICCKVCGKSFHANVSLVNHMEVHSKDVCGVCGERFDTEESFRVHLKTHVRAGICSVCGKCFGTSGALETHMRIHTGEKPFNCSECGKSFSCRHNMMRHIRIHTGEKPYTCSTCGKCFNDYSTMKRHLVVHVHKKKLEPKKTSTSGNEPGEDKNRKAVSPKKPRTICEVCGKMFHSMVSLVNHAKSHATDLCGVCGTHFSSVENLKLHLKTHKNGKVCEVCGKCFDGQGSLEMHMRIHTGEKPFLCSECGKSFSCRHNMTRHIRTHTGEKPYACNTCGRCFSDHSSLKQHSSTHSGEKSHRCEICGKGFYRKANLRLHMKSHATKK